MSSQSPLPPRVLPPRPQCRPAPSRVGTVCFWTVFLLFLAGLVFLGILAYTRNAGQAEPQSGPSDLLLGLLLVIFAIIIVVTCTAAKNHHRNR